MAVLVMIGSFAIGPFLNWSTGREFGPVVALGLVVVMMLVVLAWSEDIGMRKGTALLILVPFIGFYYLGLAVYRICSLPDRYWGDSAIPPRWNAAQRIASAFGIVLIVLVFYGPLRNTSFKLNRGFQESVQRHDRMDSSFGESEVVLAIRRGNKGFVLRRYRGEQSNSSTQWWAPVEHWYGRVWEPVSVNTSYGTSLDRVHCNGPGEDSHCLVTLPEEAAWFEVTAGGRTYAGVASAGWALPSSILEVI